MLNLSRCLMAAAASVAGMALAAPALAADFIDFETGAPATFAATTPLTTFYSNRGVTFEAVGQLPGSILDQTSGFGIGAHSGNDFLAFNASLGSSGERIRFASPITAFSLFVGSGQINGLSVRYFDVGNVLLSSQTAILTPGVYRQLSFAGPLSYVELAPLTPYWVADDLSFTLNGGVPEPATWAMMLLGFGMIGGAQRRRARRQRALA
jgi:PEP-CTERM motif